MYTAVPVPVLVALAFCTLDGARVLIRATPPIFRKNKIPSLILIPLTNTPPLLELGGILNLLRNEFKSSRCSICSGGHFEPSSDKVT